MARQGPVDDLDHRIRLMVEYLRLKVAERDWHGVADAAMDLRELEATRRERARRRGK